MKDDMLYLIHIAECVADINEYVVGGKPDFMASKMKRDAVIRKLQTMAESTIRLSEDLKSSHPEVNWQQIRGFRNILVHDYLNVDLAVVWSIVQNDLPPLKAAVEMMFSELDE